MPSRLRRPSAAAIIVVLAVAAASAGCRPDATAPATIPQATFVDVMVALRQAADTLHEVEEFRAEQERILRQAGVTDSALMEFVRVHGRDPQRMAMIWDTIAVRLIREHDPNGDDVLR
jgi:predicted protein tyrosine phosphatase